MSSPSIFISYSTKDLVWKERILTHLGALEREGLLETWDDHQIKAGDDWRKEIGEKLISAKAAILLISPNFLNSDFILDEEVPIFLERAKNEGMKIFPLILRPCLWEEIPWLKRLQARPQNGRALSSVSESQADEDIVTFAREILALLKKPSNTSPEDDEGIKTYNPPEKIDLTSLPIIDPEVYGREKELDLLHKAWENPRTKIISFIAWGGVGKSALVNAWLNDMDEQNFKGAARVYGWSFYSQGTKESTQASADKFINDAFNWFGYQGEIPQSPFDRGRKLGEIISQEKTLLILDGLEPLQYPPGPMRGRLRDQGMAGFLKGLSRSMNGLCVISSRINIADLKNTEGRMTQSHFLGKLSDKAGKELLKKYGLKGSEKEFFATTQEFKGHALALHLIGSYLNSYHDGDIRKRDLIPKITEDEERGGHARRVMKSYEKWFEKENQPELDILNLMGLFDRPASKEALEVLVAAPAIPGLTERLQHISDKEWKNALNHLRKLRLLAEEDKNDPGSLDCHPLIREHFGEKFSKGNSEAWQAAHGRLYEYYKSLPEKELPDTLEEMEPLFAAVMHGCLAGFHTRAWEETYWKRIKRGNEHYSTQKIGAYGADLTALSNYFEVPWETPTNNLRESRRALVLSFAGFRLHAVGRLSEAEQPMKTDLAMAIEQNDIKGAATSASNLSELSLTLGDVAAAQSYGAQAVDFADRSGDGFEKESDRAIYADALLQAGKIQAAERLFLEVEEMQKERKPEYAYLYSLTGFKFCDLLLERGKYEEVLERAKATIKIHQRNNWLLDIGVDLLSIGKALMLQAITNQPSLSPQSFQNTLQEAGNYLNQAVEGLRKAGTQHHIPQGLLARASFFKHQTHFSQAWTDLDEVLEIATYGQMRLHLTDYHLEACRVIHRQLEVGAGLERFEVLEDGETLKLSKEEMEGKFKMHLEQAAALVEETGYHRRGGEVEELRGILETFG